MPHSPPLNQHQPGPRPASRIAVRIAARIAARIATVADAPSISACVHAAYAHYIPRMGKKPGPMLDDYAQIVQEHTVYVIESEVDSKIGHMAGCDCTVAQMKENPAGVAEVMAVLVLIEKGKTENVFLLDNIAVHPSAQGRGYGRLLMNLAETVARERGYEAIHLYTHELMTENIQLYKRWEYTETERRTEKGFQRVYMQKKLDSLGSQGGK